MPAELGASGTASAYVSHCCRVRASVWNGALGVGVLTGVALLAFPEIDLQVSSLFYGGKGAFAGQSLGWVNMLRSAFIGLFYLSIATTISGLILTRIRGRTWLQLAFAQWLFLALCLAAGPGLVANFVFKDHWGRARPKQVVEFGGVRAFTPPLLPARECGTNCSFVSGEAASMFLPLYAASLVMPQSAVLLVGAGSVIGLAAGVVRMAQGAHFLSDVIFAGVFMALTAVLVHIAMFGRLATRPA